MSRFRKGQTVSTMTSWSRYDPVHKAGNTDHWTKLKCRSNTYRATQSANNLRIIAEHEIDPLSSVTNPGERFKVMDGSTVTKLPALTFNDKVLTDLDGKMPGDYDKLTRPSSNIQRRWLDNIHQKKAREGFRYWLINRPLPTNFGKYGMGSYKMVMGIGMAPRT